MTEKLPKNTPHVLNAFVVWVSLPALILIQIPQLLGQISLSSDLLIPMSMPWIQFMLAFVIFDGIGKKCKWGRAEIGALVLTAGLGNTAFLGYPILESLFGEKGLRIAVVVDQLGTFLVLSTLAVISASHFSPTIGRKVRFNEVLMRVFTFPPFLSIIAAGIWHFSGRYGYSQCLPLLEKLSATVIPLALVAVGFQLKVSMVMLKRQWKPLSLGLFFKLIVAPLVFIIIYVSIFSSHTFVVRVTVLQAAMAPMILGAVLAEEFGLNAEISSLMVGVGIPVSMATVYLWNQLPIMQGMH